MRIDEAQYQFWNSFGIDFYPSTSVPDGAKFPYGTYDYYDGDFLTGEADPSIGLFFWSESEAAPNKVAQSIAQKIGMGGYMLKHDTGAIWIKKGSPFCQSVKNPVSTVKQRHINVRYEFINM